MAPVKSTILNDYATRGCNHSSLFIGEKGRRRRVYGLSLLACAWSCLLIGRLFSLQVSSSDFWQGKATNQHFSEVKLSSERGPVYDRNGQLLAVSVPAGSIAVRPRRVANKQETAEKLAAALNMDSAHIAKLLESPQPFVWVKRQIPRLLAQKVAALEIPGVELELEAKRFYPYKQAASTLIGRVGIDGNGLSGLEARYDRLLSGEQLKAKFTRDGWGHRIQEDINTEEPFSLPRGSELHLTLDASMQYILDDELEAARKNSAATAALGVLVDTETGDILALGQSPSFNFNEDNIKTGTALTNRVVETVFEPGSIMKPIVAAAAINSGVIRSTDIVDCERGAYRFGGHTIKDTHRVGAVPFRDVIVHSSNIGMTKVGAKMGRDRLYDSLTMFGFGALQGLNLPGETKGILRNKANWSTVDIATHAFGQGIAVTPLQMVRALSAIANGGVLPNLRLVQDKEFVPGHRIISEEAAASVRDMMFGVVEDAHGTGKRGAIPGVRVGGKTGTAQKARKDGRGYAPGKYMASFMGFVDASDIQLDEKLALLITIDEPTQGSIYGGTAAAPVFKNVMTRVLQLLATRHRLKNIPEERYVAAKSSFVPAVYRE